MSYGCKCQCESFRDHIGNGPYIAAEATPTKRQDVLNSVKTEKRWAKENEAFKRLAKEGYTLPRLTGADQIEKKATTEIELKHGKLYGASAAVMERADKGDL